MFALDKYKSDSFIVRNQNSAHSYGEILEFKIQKINTELNSPGGGLSWERDGDTVITRISAASSQQQDGACGFDWLLVVFTDNAISGLKNIFCCNYYMGLKNIFLLRFFRGSYLLWSLPVLKGKEKQNT